MLYSSCKSPFLETATKHLGIELSKKMEVDAKDDLSEAALLEALHPVEHESPKMFARPAPPKGAGARRITKV
ncbi:unnamed protein product [Nippostrongylus brasiliensis]|uniref:ADF-H domain-containing protein n=1 Tax=Nippostrongylus brasiliensis TaxID=27835 RepID=A0A0N4YK26_NIPBR|nr:unnamed protein product [Nippostrongylus brasiliensis]